MRRTLTLKKETLAALSAGELGLVVGGGAVTNLKTECFCSDFAACGPPEDRCPTTPCGTLNGC